MTDVPDITDILQRIAIGMLVPEILLLLIWFRLGRIAKALERGL